MDHRAELFDRIERVLAGNMPPGRFEDEFYNLYFDSTPESALTDLEHDFISTVCERLDYTGPDPDAESRSYGWGDYAEFVDWLRDAYTTYRTRSWGSGDHDHAI